MPKSKTAKKLRMEDPIPASRAEPEDVETGILEQEEAPAPDTVFEEAPRFSRTSRISTRPPSRKAATRSRYISAR
jgi:hypothetical protein